MEGIYISNINAASKIAANSESEQAAKQAASECLEEAKLCYSGYPIAMTVWSDPSSNPDRTHNYCKMMIDPSSAKNSAVVTTSDTANGNSVITLPMSSDDCKKVIDSDAKFAIVFSVDGYDADGASICMNSSLVLELTGFDSNNGFPKFKAVNGRKMSPSDELTIVPVIPAESIVVLLKECPGMRYDVSDANVFLLDVDCPAISPDAKRGDIFYFGEYGFAKTYSIQQKIDAMKRQPSKKIPGYGSAASNKCRAYFVNSLDNIDRVMMHSNYIYALLMEDMVIPAQTSTQSGSGSGSGSSGSSSTTETVTPAKVYKKGSFFFVDNSGSSLKYTQVPFNLFFQE